MEPMGSVPPQNRRLAAVMFLDMVGYSALMSKSEARALACVRALETILRQEVPAAGGRLVKFMGDGSMAEFPTAGGAVACAKRILDAIAAKSAASPDCPFSVRIGLHMGELHEEAGDIFGDAVNIAARVQPLADPGGIAMTGAVHSQVKNQLVDLKGTLLPPQKLKNIPERIGIFLVAPAGASYSMWAARRRLRPAALAFGLGAALVASGGVWAWKHYSEGPMRIVYILVAGQEGDPASVALAHEIEDELNDMGGRLHGVQWASRPGVLQQLFKKGIKDPEKLMRAESGACLVARDMGLKLAIAGRLRRNGPGWRLETGVTDVEELVVLGSFSVEGADARTLADATLTKIQAWLNDYFQRMRR